MQWPRDADRLPNGHTLVADSNSGRIIEIDESGAVVWSVNGTPGNYDIERFGTGDESAGSESASELNLTGTSSRVRSVDETQNLNDGLKQKIKSSLPPILFNSLIYVTPTWWNWLGVDGILFILMTTSGGYLFVLNLRNLSFRSPVTRDE